MICGLVTKSFLSICQWRFICHLLEILGKLIFYDIDKSVSSRQERVELTMITAEPHNSAIAKMLSRQVVG